MPFDIDGARKAGYSDAEIADHLAQSSKFDITSARQSGYSDSEILQHLTGSQQTQEKGILEKVGGYVVDAAKNYVQNKIDESAGVIRGAGSIGATLLAPYDIAKDAIDGKGLSLQSNRERRQSIDQGLSTLGANPDSLGYKVGKIGAEIAGTAGIGGIAGKAAQAIGAAPKVVSALSSGGFELGSPTASTIAGKAADVGLRAGAGAITGALQAGAVDPEQAGAGAVIGGALPGATKLAGEAGRLAKKAAGIVTTNFLGATTGAGADAIKAAYDAGINKSKAFLDNVRGNAEFSDIVDSARSALSAMKQQKSAEYASGMVNVKNDKTVLDFAKIDTALNDVINTGSYKGVSIRKNASETMDQLKEVVDQWKALDPAEYHTPEGLDALKQAIWDVAETTKPGTSANRAVKQVYNAVKSTITDQAPAYAKVMKDYQDAAESLREIEKALSLGDKNKTAIDTSIRKLQSIMRNNVNTTYGNRAALVKKLEDQGGADLVPAIAGQSMNSWAPRGMVGAIEKAGTAGAAGAAALGYVSPLALALAPATSPRLVGESAYLLGRASGSVGSALGTGTAGNALTLLSRGSGNGLPAPVRTAPLLILAGQRNQQ